MMITINCLATIFILLPINVIVSITMLDVIVVPSNPLCSRSGQTSRHETRQKTARKLEFFAKAMGMFGISDIETYPNMSKHVHNCWLIQKKHMGTHISKYPSERQISGRQCQLICQVIPCQRKIGMAKCQAHAESERILGMSWAEQLLPDDVGNATKNRLTEFDLKRIIEISQYIPCEDV